MACFLKSIAEEQARQGRQAHSLPHLLYSMKSIQSNDLSSHPTLFALPPPTFGMLPEKEGEEGFSPSLPQTSLAFLGSWHSEKEEECL